MEISSYFGKPVSELKNVFEKMHISISDTNNNSVFDKDDICSYTVQDGDSLWKIARQFDGYKVKDLKEDDKNGFIKNSDTIRPDDIINIPLVLGQTKPKEKSENSVQQPKTNTQADPNTQSQPQASSEKSEEKGLFGNIKTKKVSNADALKNSVGKNTEELQSEGYYFVDTNKNDKYDEGEELHKQVTVMLDAGHGSGVHLQPNKTITLPNGKKYTTKKDDTLADIAKNNNTTEEELKKLNPDIKYSRDPGAVPPKEYGSHDEAYIAGLAMDELHKILEEKGFKVIDNVRTDGVKKHRAERRKNKLKVKPDMFISLHLNSSADKTADGELICYNPTTPEDKKFAQTVNDALSEDNTILRNRGIQKRPPNTDLSLGVLNGDDNANIAEILVEMGFISNKDDYDKLDNSDTRKKQLEAIARGVVNYYNTEINK